MGLKELKGYEDLMTHGKRPTAFHFSAELAAQGSGQVGAGQGNFGKGEAWG